MFKTQIEELQKMVEVCVTKQKEIGDELASEKMKAKKLTQAIETLKKLVPQEIQEAEVNESIAMEDYTIDASEVVESLSSRYEV